MKKKNKMRSETEEERRKRKEKSKRGGDSCLSHEKQCTPRTKRRGTCRVVVSIQWHLKHDHEHTVNATLLSAHTKTIQMKRGLQITLECFLSSHLHLQSSYARRRCQHACSVAGMRRRPGTLNQQTRGLVRHVPALPTVN